MKLQNLQVLRGISALLVCGFHMTSHLNQKDFLLGDILFSRGSLGVPIFFVISGFIMAYTTQNINLNQQNILSQIASFLKKRIIRIVPLYYFLSFAWIVMGGSLFLIFEGEAFKRVWHSILFLPQNGVPPVLFLGWSLNFEMFFYLIFSLSFFLFSKRYWFVFLFFITAITIGWFTKIESAYLQMVTNIINIYFLIGIAFALIFHKIRMSKAVAIVISIFGGLSFLFLLFAPDGYIDNVWTIMLIITLIVFSFLLMDYIIQFKPYRFWVHLGNISYSVYLVHPFVEIVTRKYKLEGWLNIPLFMGKIGLVILISTCTYYLIEKKFTNYLKSKLA